MGQRSLITFMQESEAWRSVEWFRVMQAVERGRQAGR